MSGPGTDIDDLLAQRLDAGIERLGDLPVLDRTLVRVRELAEDPEATTHELVVALQADANLAANLLRYANSALSARPVRASTLHQAVTLVGRRAVGRLALEAEVCSFFERAPGTGAARGQHHVHAVQVGACAAEFARRAGADSGTAHLAGLLHDLGKLVLPATFGAEVLDAIAQTTPAGAARVLVERETLGIDHALAGARFAETAGLDPEVVEAIAHHHGTPEGVTTSTIACTVQAADATVALLNGHPIDHELLQAAMTELGLPLTILEDIASAAMPAVVADREAPTGLADQVSRLEREARTDDLTDLLNRRYWSIAARQHLSEHPGTVLICDVDHFKRINDFHGHHTGDFVLLEIARLLSGHGIAGRLGGDEFALLTPRADPDGRAAAQIIADVSAAFPADGLDIGVSIGVATAHTSGADLSELLREADTALYQAKNAGRNTFRAAA
jgi:diguanylate cyclase (GGDEF)-like protein/putative nucleotidyltransferase with HDIG domain